MRCSKCGSENREGRKFCRSCGTPLVAVCPKCDAAVEQDEKFCGECGTALITPTRTHSSKPAEGNQPLPENQVTAAHGCADVLDGERKTVTALFADIKDSTELLRDLDPEEARSLIDPALNLMVGAVRRYNGYVVQSTGDGIFALFGAPRADEDHAQRALYAALDMQKALREHSAKLEKRSKATLTARIGVNSGEVVMRTVETAGRVEHTPVGHALKTET